MGRLLTALRRIEARSETDIALSRADIAVPHADIAVPEEDMAATSRVESAPAESAAWNEEPAAPWGNAFQNDPSVDYFAPWGDRAAVAVTDLDANEPLDSTWPEARIADEPSALPVCDLDGLEPVEDVETAADVASVENTAPLSAAEMAAEENPEVVSSAVLVGADKSPQKATDCVPLTYPAAEGERFPEPENRSCQADKATASVVKPAAIADIASLQPQWIAERDSTLPGPTTPAASAAQADEVDAESADDEEPVATVRLPGYGRPPRGLRAGSEGAFGGNTPALVPFKPAAQRPYREVCENIVAALPSGKSVALVLAWADEDLDQAPLSARIAESLADRMEDPVLLIDLGSQRRLSGLLHVPALGNLTEALAGRVSWRDQIVQTGTAGLCVLPSAPHDFDADPVAVARLIEGCKEDFGTVLITGGALRTMPDNLLLASDAAVLLVEADCTSTTNAMTAIDRLRRCGADVIGGILTGVCDVK